MGRHTTDLTGIYRQLLARFGPQGWWPGDSPLEVVVGAVLTQNTAWTNVAKAISNLKAAGLLSGPRALAHLLVEPADRLEYLIRPSGYYRLKAARLRNVLRVIEERFGDLEGMAAMETAGLRALLLGSRGVGPETADSILLYALGRPVFVVDAYTRRVLSRHGLVGDDAGYDEIQALFMENLDPDATVFNEYHALIVRLAKEHCAKRSPGCAGCPLTGTED
ncbi:MAG: endonuclease III domain-containing protein [Pseudomonadota bacterium]